MRVAPRKLRAPQGRRLKRAGVIGAGQHHATFARFYLKILQNEKPTSSAFTIQAVELRRMAPRAAATLRSGIAGPWWMPGIPLLAGEPIRETNFDPGSGATEPSRVCLSAFPVAA